MSMIVSERDNHIIILTKDNKYEHRPSDSYNKLKYGTYNANRIFYTWDSEARVEETYDDRIFNCYYKEELLQLRKSNDICTAILDNDKDLFIEVFKRDYYNLHKAQLIEGMINNNPDFKDRVKRTKDDCFIVDDVFKIDGHANTSVLESVRSKKPRWKSLCTVIKGTNKKRTIKTKEVGDIEVDQATLNCMSKVLYLMQPMLWDQIVWNQIPTWLKKIYKAEIDCAYLNKYLGTIDEE